MITRSQLAPMIDYSLLSADATPSQLRRACMAARKWRFNSVCVNPIYVERARTLLRGSPIKVTAVIGYPLGALVQDMVVYEARRCINLGADELDVVMPIGLFKAKQYSLVSVYIRNVVRAAKKIKPNTIVKIIIEAGMLTKEEIIKASQLVKAAGADFVKSGTGWSAPATPYIISLIRRSVGPDFGIKAAGGIRTAKQCIKLIAAGANRIGTSSGPQIMEQLKT